jgi:hypothetical protein
MATHMRATLVIDALQMALSHMAVAATAAAAATSRSFANTATCLRQRHTTPT